MCHFMYMYVYIRTSVYVCAFFICVHTHIYAYQLQLMAQLISLGQQGLVCWWLVWLLVVIGGGDW